MATSKQKWKKKKKNTNLRASTTNLKFTHENQLHYRKLCRSWEATLMVEMLFKKLINDNYFLATFLLVQLQKETRPRLCKLCSTMVKGDG